MSWADAQTRIDRGLQESQERNNELRLREQRLKDGVGKGCFAAVKAYVRAEVEKYAKHSPAVKLMFFPDTSVEEEQDFMSKIPSFTIVSQGGARVYVRYSENHALLWRCGALQGIYELRVYENGSCDFVGNDGKPKSDEQVGNDLLSIVRNAEPNTGRWMWA